MKHPCFLKHKQKIKRNMGVPSYLKKLNFIMMKKKVIIFSISVMLINVNNIKLFCQKSNEGKIVSNDISAVWVSDNGDGTYKNPILYADYSDPDVIRIEDDYYMTASSFNCVPGLPILHSKDLVNWKIIGYALEKQPPYDVYDKPQHGNGVWAPCIRYHNSEFYIFYPDPDYGIYVIKAKNINGPWSDPLLIKSGKGFIDPSPLWDDDGNAYLVHAFAGSRAQIKSVLVVCKMTPEATKVLDDGVLVFDGHDKHPTLEGPKFYKRNGYYYIFAPAGGVSTGWQLILRSKNIYGPYEEKVVLEQGKSPVNGPHQGAWVDTRSGEDWFIHFQDKGPYGRIVHLQPMKWVNDWPVMGIDKDGNKIGEPVLVHKKPSVLFTNVIETPAVNDEFNTEKLGLQWQWHANPEPTWAFMNPSKGSLRLNSVLLPDNYKNLWNVPNLLLQKFTAPKFTATTKISYNLRVEGETLGFIVMGMDYAYIAVTKSEGNNYISYSVCKNADKSGNEELIKMIPVTSNNLFLRIQVDEGAICKFSFSEDGKNFVVMGENFHAREGKWIGAKIGYFFTRPKVFNDAGSADIDWFRVE
jgi:beta-xylosidase